MQLKYQKEVMDGLIIIVAAATIYSTFAPAKCEDYSCFAAHMTKCKSATYINEEDEAAWGYRIMGKS